MNKTLTLSEALKVAEILGELCGHGLLSEAEIVEKSTPITKHCGIYFLILNKKIIYIGQSINVFGRIAEHSRYKKFDRFAYLPCLESHLDKIESLYIHLYQPEQNGNSGKDGGKCAPLSLKEILDL